MKTFFWVRFWCLLFTFGTIPTNVFAIQMVESSPNAQKVYTGIYLMNVYDININEHSFYADFYLWFKWKGERDPTAFEFVNVIEKWSLTQTPFEDSIKVLSNGYNYAGMRVEGRFYCPFQLQRFPLDKHALRIAIENTKYPYDSLVYLPDSAAFTLHDGFALPGWNIEQIAGNAQKNTYRSDFGDADEGIGTYSNFAFELHIARPLSYFWFKLFLPLLVVVISALGAMLVFPSYIDARISLPIGALLTAVFLQQAYSDALPETGGMVLIDKIYVLSYVVITMILFKIIVSGNAVKVFKKSLDMKALLRRDYWLAFVFALCYAVGIAVLLLC